MTAHEMARKLLSGPDVDVHISYTSGDYWRTVVAPKAKSAEPGHITVSMTYYDLPKVDESSEGRLVILIG